MASAEQLIEARDALREASSAMDCFLAMVSQLPRDATVPAGGLYELLLPVYGHIDAAMGEIGR